MRKTVGFGTHRLKLHPNATREERLQRSSEMLSRALNLRTTVAVVGAGFSVSMGYPTWRTMALEIVDRTVQHLLEASPDQSGSFEPSRLLQFKGRLESDQVPSPEDLMFYIGTCKRLLSDLNCGSNPFDLYLEERFQLPERKVEIEFDPFRALLELKISRFVTTNYDCEIERALSEEHRIPLPEFGIGGQDVKASCPRLLSFTQKPENQDQLALFALGRVEAARNMVFHCHGRYDDPDSIIAGEADYQRWYLAGEAEDGTAFLQTIKLIFNSNPILLVGYSLGDEDLLRQLRLISAVHPARKDARPLFALMPESSDGADFDYHEQLYERYGVHVLPFEAPDDRGDWGRVYCRQLERLKRNWRDWRVGWLQKPLIRRVEVGVRPPRSYRHYDLDTRGQVTLGKERVDEKLRELEKAALAKARVIALVGPGGTGKSYHALKFLDRMQRKSNGFQGFFFWSSYYADDSLTGTDRLLAYLDPEGDRRISRFKRLRASIREGRYLLVFDGFERLLRESETPDEGKSHDPGVKELLKVFSESENQSTIVLTSRLWPTDLEPDQKWILPIDLERMRTADIKDVEPFSWFEESELSGICSLLEGHTYGLALAARYLGRKGRSQAPLRLAKLRRRLADTPPDRRVSRMIRVAIQAIDDETDGMALAFLERLAVFMSPVGRETISLCYQLASHSVDLKPSALPPFDEFIETLVRSQLFFRVLSGPGGTGPSSYTVHPTVRSYVFREVHRAESDALPNFTLAGFTSGTAAVHPGSREMRGKSASCLTASKPLPGKLFRMTDWRRPASFAGASSASCVPAWKPIRSRVGVPTLNTFGSGSGWQTWPRRSRLACGAFRNATKSRESNTRRHPFTLTNWPFFTTTSASLSAARAICSTRRRSGSKATKSTAYWKEPQRSPNTYFSPNFTWGIPTSKSETSKSRISIFTKQRKPIIRWETSITRAGSTGTGD